MKNGSSHFARLGCSICALTIALGPAGASPSLALSPAQMGDGEPSVDACARLGFSPSSRDDDRGRRVGGGVQFSPMAVAAPPPPSPPMPYPQTERRVEPAEIAVTAKRAAPSGVVGGFLPQQQPRDTERYRDIASNTIRQTAEAPVSTFSIDVDTASYANARRFLQNGTRPPRDAVRVEEMINYFDYGYAKPAAGEPPFKPFVAVAPSPWSQAKQIVHIGLQGYDVPRAEQPPLNLVFLIDVSGSMSDADKLPMATKALNLLIDQLRPQDHVAMAVYAGQAGAVLEPTDGRQKLRMRCALGALHAGGSTAGGQGLALAYAMAQQNFRKDAVNRVILMTDGDFNVGVTSEQKLEDFVADKRKSGVYLSVYGLGQGNYNDVMMQTLAQSGNGTAAYIDSLNEARKLFRDDFSGSVFPIADDVKIQVEFNPARVAEYRLVGYETRMLNREDFNNDQVDAGEVGSGASVTALYEITPVGGPRSADPLRYGATRPETAGSGELAYLKVRYKLPGGTVSKLIERPIGDADRATSLTAAPEATRWAVAVAGYGQKLRGDPWVGDSFGWDRVRDMAQAARGDDPFGLRAEFVQLARAAQDSRSSNE